jgi:hypothetical protein
MIETVLADRGGLAPASTFSMLSLWLDRFGDWNPQLWRELKQRLRGRSLLLTTALSLLGQWFLAKDLGLIAASRANSSAYDGLAPIVRSHLTWRLTAFDLLSLLTWTVLWLLMVVGSYLLARDLRQEIRRGTLTFLRLSGFPAGKILLGKALGVPVLLHWAIVLVLPLQLWTATQAGGLLEAIGIDGAVILISAAVYIITIQTIVEWGRRARLWLIPTATSLCFLPCLSFGQAFIWSAREAVERSIVTGTVQSGSCVLIGTCLGLLLLMIGITLTCWRLCIHLFNHPASPSPALAIPNSLPEKPDRKPL